MLAAQFLAADRIEAVETPVPTLQSGEALVKIEACGICGSDLSIVAGTHPRARPPLTIGHELCGRVVAAEKSKAEGPDAPQVDVGDRVTLFPLITCGECFVCRNGLSHVCRRLRLYGFDADGGMADYLRVPIANLLPIPESMAPEVGALLEPLAVGMHAVSRVCLQPTDTVVVVGGGPIGLVTALALRHQGIEPLCISDINPFRLELAGALRFQAIDPRHDDLAAYVRSRTSDEGADAVFEVAGVPAAAAQMTELARCRGTIVNVSVFKKPVTVDMQAVNFKELAVVGTRVYTADDFREAIKAAAGLEVRQLVTHMFGLAEITEAFSLFKQGGNVCKVLLTPQDDQPANSC